MKHRDGHQFAADEKNNSASEQADEGAIALNDALEALCVFL